MSSVKDFGAAGDGKTDDTGAIEHAVKDGDGVVRFPRGVYLIRRTIEIPLDRSGPLGLDGTGGTAKVVMAGPGPAFRFVGTHGGTGDPLSVKPPVWEKQRLPTVRNIEITATHPAADGLELVGAMQSLIEGVLIRQVRHGIRLHQRNRNVLISHSHVYHNTGVGVFLDRVNLHQINISGNHISYNRLGGIRIEGSEIRNLQITGNDIEYNNHRSHETEPAPTAEIYVDTTAEGASVAEITVASNTIQATPSPGGANIRLIEPPGRGQSKGLWTITGNVIGSQENNVHLTHCRGVVLSGNWIYSCTNRNLLIENSSQITVGSCIFRRHTKSMHTGVRLEGSTDCAFNGCTLEDETDEGQSTGASLLEIVNSERITVNGCQVLGGVPHGIDVSDSSHVNINACTVTDPREEPHSRSNIRFAGKGRGSLVTANLLGKAKVSAVENEEKSGAVVQFNSSDADGQ